MGDFFEVVAKIVVIALCLETYGVVRVVATEYSRKKHNKDGYFFRETWQLAFVVSFFFFGLVIARIS